MNISKSTYIRAALAAGGAITIGVMTIFANAQTNTNAQRPATMPAKTAVEPAQEIDETISVPAQRTYSVAYNVLQRRSLFYKGVLPIPGVPQNPRPYVNPNLQEERYTFTGGVNDFGFFIAHLEDQNTGRILDVYVGTQIAQGKVTSISLDKLEYTGQDGKPREINIGDNLAQSRQIQQNQQAMQATSAPSDLSAVTDITERLRLKRLAEQKAIGGK